jgi:hypothetical protein
MSPHRLPDGTKAGRRESSRINQTLLQYSQQDVKLQEKQPIIAQEIKETVPFLHEEVYSLV